MKYKLLDQNIIRITLLPFSNTKKANAEESNPESAFHDPLTQETIYIASPLLTEELRKLVEGEIKNKKEIERIHQSLSRYLTRMSTRCTPFGLFAGCSTGEFSVESNIRIKDSLKRVTRLDMYYLCVLIDTILSKPEIRIKLNYYSNTSLYLLGDRYRYIEYKTLNNNRSYQISEVESSIYLKKILNKSTKGTTIPELVSLLTAMDIEEEDAFAYINELIDSQILQNELTQSVTGEDYFTRLIDLLQKIQAEPELIEILKDIQQRLWELDNTSHTVDLYKEIIEKIKSLQIPFEEKYLFQVDTVRETYQATLGENVAEELKSTLTFLNKITPPSENQTLTKFQQDFYARYEDEEIPLMEVLDTEIGLGYPSNSKDGDISPLVDDFGVPARTHQTGSATNNNPLQTVLLQKTVECLAKKGQEIVLTEDDISGRKANWEDLPPVFSCMFEVLKDNEQDVSIMLKSAGGNGANLLARFAHTDEKIEALVKEITFKEQELMPEVILAEIVHLPEARIGNILYRPHIREYELLYMANSDLPRDKVIPVSDLMLSVKQNRLVIRSKKLNKEIVPRLTNAHNYRNRPLPVYHFLCDMQMQQGRRGLYFTWGSLENELPFRPRVRYKNTILSEAYWTIKGKDMKHLFEIEDDKLLIEEITKWRESISLPRRVLLPDGDNELYVDWENPLSIQALFAIIKKRTTIAFKEFLFEPVNAVVKGEDGSYLNECIAIFYKSEK